MRLMIVTEVKVQVVTVRVVPEIRVTVIKETLTVMTVAEVTVTL